MNALTLMMVYLWVGPIQLLHSLYRWTRKTKHPSYYRDQIIYLTLVVIFLLVMIITPEEISNTKFLGGKLAFYYIITAPGLIASYYTYICVKKYPNLEQKS